MYAIRSYYGSLAMSWFYTPALGTEHIDYDYYHVVAFSRYSG